MDELHCKVILPVKFVLTGISHVMGITSMAADVSYL